MTDGFKFDVTVPAFVPGGAAAAPTAVGEIKNKTQQPPKAPQSERGQRKGRGNQQHQRSLGGNGQQQQRPRPRKQGGFSGGNPSRSTQSQDNWDLDDYIDQAELATTNGRNRRGQVSLTHLLEFSNQGASRNGPGSYDFRRSGGGGSRRRRDSGGNHSGLYAISSHHPPADKTTYINTTCRFVMDPRYSELYEPLLVDPDIPVPMAKVMRVLSRPSACPICLENIPKAPRMLACGHVMCSPCLLRYVDSFQPPPAPPPVVGAFTSQPFQPPKKAPPAECPLCFEYIKIDHVKPVSFILFDERFELPKEGQDVVMKLMFRPQSDANSIPFATVAGGQTKRKDFIEMPVMQGGDTEASGYSRLAKASHAYLTQELEREIKELEEQKSEEMVLYQDESLTKFHTHAISKIRKSLYEVNELFEDFKSQELAEKLTQATLHQDVTTNVDSFNDSTAFYYYQTAFQSEIKFFLAPLDVKILRAEFGGSFSGLPSSLVVHVDNIVYSNYVNDELRKRLKYMSNIPSGTQVAFLECKWAVRKDDGSGPSDGISAETLEKFSKELAKRRKLKAEKTHRENTHARKIQRQEKSLLREDLLRESGVDIAAARTASEDGPMNPDLPLPSLPHVERDPDNDATSSSRRMRRTVWGTSVPEENARNTLPPQDDEYYDYDQPPSGNYRWADFSSLSETVKDSSMANGNGGGGKGRKHKKKVLLSSTSGGR